MNLDELDNSATDSDSGHSVNREEQGHRNRHSTEEAPGLPSIPFDPEWVSPFTLPPLPALRKNRGHSKLLRSPEERLHQRSTSSAYYAAAWGSPYATPSPNRSPPHQRLARRSQDLETASPLASRIQEYTPDTSDLRETSRVSKRKLSPESVVARRASSWDRARSLSERFNWLSESDLSGSEADILVEQTPTRDTYLKGLKASVDDVRVPRSRTHQVQESVATITPETFNAADENLVSYNDVKEGTLPDMEQTTEDTLEARLAGGSVDKPLPSLPSLNTVEKKAEITPYTASPDSPSRPRLSSIQSFQRPKRKVTWKGKTCIIALPLTDRETAKLPPLLTSDEIKQHMRKWAAQGYDINQLASGGPQDITSGFGQSRPLFPDPEDMHAERKHGKLEVHIPNQAEWDAWVEYLKEEKLRALGVTPSNSEPPMSVQSPFSSTLSRVSSTHPSAASPPIGTLSANGNAVRIAGNTFSPPLGYPGSINSRSSSHVASPSISGYHGPMHGYKQSIAQQRLTSPYDYPVSHPGSFGPGMRNTPGGYGMRQFSPPTATNLQSFGQVLSPMVMPTIPSNDNGRGMAQAPTMEQIRQQQQRQQQLHQHMMQHQRQYSYFPPQSKSADQLPRTPTTESPSRKTPEIMHPTPRSHRHNLSAALQKGVDDAEAALSNRQSPVRNGNRVMAADEKVETAEEKIVDEPFAEDEQEADLPVLKRPETLADVDDKSEIETNPSIAASPMLMDNKNAFTAPPANIQKVKDAFQPQSQHQAKLSISRLNVDAPVFDPQARFSSSNFSFGAPAFQPATATSNKPLVAGSRPAFTPKNLSISGLNVDAPAFTPSFVAETTPSKAPVLTNETPAKQSTVTPSKASFTFSSPLNVEAPEFTPSQTFSFTTSAQSLRDDKQPSTTYAGSIFGNVTIDANNKVNRRGTKTVPILRPKSAEATDNEPADDDEGRVSAPVDRQKRARRIGGEDNEELLFASSAPFDHAEGLSANAKEAIEEDATESVRELEVALKPEVESNEPHIREQQSEKGKSEDEAPRIADHKEDELQVAASDTAEGEREEILIAADAHEHRVASAVPSDDAVSREVTHVTDDSRSDISPGEDAVTVAIDAAKGSDHTDQEEILVTENSRDEPNLESTIVPTQGTHKSQFSLSALAKPFEFRPGAASTFVPTQALVSQPTVEPKIARGLMASRYATASPEPEPPKTSQRSHSPPQDMYEYIQPEDASQSKQPSLEEPLQALTATPNLPNIDFDATPQLMKSIEESMRAKSQRSTRSHSSSQHSAVEEPMPTYEEIDAVMKQFESNPDLGVERDDTPVKSTPLIDMRFPPTFRSDAPSPSPRRAVLSPQQRADWGLGIHKLNDGNEEVSDWNDEFSPRQEDKLQAQAHYFDNHVNNLVGNILETRLGPFEQALQTIQGSLATLLEKPQRNSARRSMSTENKEDSDADDEDDADAFEGFSAYRSRSPSRNQRKADKMRTAIMDALATYQPPTPKQPAVDLSDVHIALDEMKKLAERVQYPPPSEQPDLRATMEDVISGHPHFKSMKKSEDHLAVQETQRERIEVLESSLREAEKRLETETALRQRRDEEMEQLNGKVLDAQKQASEYRETLGEAQTFATALTKEKAAHKALQSEHADLVANNEALEDTLSEYRVTSDQFRDDIQLERARNQDLIRRMHNLRQEFNSKLESRQALRNQLERLQDRMSQAMHDARAEEDEWRSKEQELVVHNKTIQAALDHELRHREKIELELDNLDKEHKENMRFKLQHEQAQQEISRLHTQLEEVTNESKQHQDNAFKLERELVHAKDSTDAGLQSATVRLQSELEAARATIDSLQTDSDAQISRLQKRLDDAELDLEEQKAKHDTNMAETLDAHNQVLHEANQKRETALEEQHASHERKLNDLRERHTRALHNSSDDRHRLEYHLNEKLSISEERAKHLESQVKDLEERLEITKSAARAAVEAATAKTTNIPTPAPSVMASPPQRLSSASLQLVKGTDIPEKISPQAMRESIMVLQDQLQNREQTIEQLEAEIAAIDKDAPAKIKERDNEIALLRELLSVRLDDLNEIITTLSEFEYDREATKNAAIRLKANLQMEQQLKERAAAVGGAVSTLPALSTISNFAQSPRGLPLAAAAAWGNWRKARDYGINAVSDIATNISQTPSKSAVGSPSGFLAGIMTPPSTSQRTPPASDTGSRSPPTMRPLAAAAAAAKRNAGGASEVRPLRTYSSQPRTLSSRKPEKRRESAESSSSDTSRRHTQPQPETPTTPLASKSFRNLDLGEDVDEDASPFDASDHANTASEMGDRTLAT